LNTDGPQKLVIGIEAKADDPFGDHLVGEYYDSPLNQSGPISRRGFDGLSRAFVQHRSPPRIETALNSAK
jgi:hypothetical protein